MSSQMGTLTNKYDTLQKERTQIARIINQQETINSAYENETVKASANYYSYIVYLIIAIFLIFLFFNFNLTGVQRGGGKSKIPFFIFLILSFIIIFNATIKKN